MPKTCAIRAPGDKRKLGPGVTRQDAPEIVAEAQRSASSSGTLQLPLGLAMNSGDAPHQRGTRSGSSCAKAVRTRSREVMARLSRLPNTRVVRAQVIQTGSRRTRPIVQKCINILPLPRRRLPIRHSRYSASLRPKIGYDMVAPLTRVRRRGGVVSVHRESKMGDCHENRVEKWRGWCGSSWPLVLACSVISATAEDKPAAATKVYELRVYTTNPGKAGCAARAIPLRHVKTVSETRYRVSGILDADRGRGRRRTRSFTSLPFPSADAQKQALEGVWRRPRVEEGQSRFGERRRAGQGRDEPEPDRDRLFARQVSHHFPCCVALCFGECPPFSSRESIDNGDNWIRWTAYPGALPGVSRNNMAGNTLRIVLQGAVMSTCRYPRLALSSAGSVWRCC